MTLYRKIPVTIEAVQLTEANLDDVIRFIEGPDVTDERFAEVKKAACDRGVYIQTLEGWMHASEGDYIIQGVKGEFYPCKPDIFALTYEEV